MLERYLVESPHTLENCDHVIDLFTAYGYIRNFDWGCKAGVHKSWAIVEAENEAQALLSVPPLIRHEAHAIRLVKYSPETLQDEHKTHGNLPGSG